MKKPLLFLAVLALAVGSICGTPKARAVSQDEHLSQRANPVSPEEEKEIQAIKETVRGSYDFQYITAFLAVRDNNPDMCRELQEGADYCQDLAKALIVIKNEAEGNCNEVKKPYAKDICNAYKTQTCDSLKEAAHRNLCIAFSKDDLTIASDALNIIAGRPLDKDEFYAQMGTFFGYKYYRSKLACEKFSKGIKGRADMICDVLFDTRSSKVIADSLLNDFAYFIAARNHNDPDLCAMIENPVVKKKCLDKKVRTLY